MGNNMVSGAGAFTPTDGEGLMDRAVELDPEADPLELEQDTLYRGTVNNVTEYGVFVQLTEQWGSDISGLVGKEYLPPLTTPRDFSPGDVVVVEMVERKDNGDVKLSGEYSPDVDASDVSLADVRDAFVAVEERTAALMDRVSELETEVSEWEPNHTPATDGNGVTVAPTLDTFARKVVAAKQRGFSVETLTTETRASGSVVELNAVLTTEPETGDTDD